MQILNERRETHGNWRQQSVTACTLKRVVRASEGYQRLTSSQTEAVDAILGKISRIVNGKPDFPDHWHDIIGYATLGLHGGDDDNNASGGSVGE